jgi:hypothetical protein
MEDQDRKMPPFWTGTIPAAFRLENVLGGSLNQLQFQKSGEPPDPDFNPFDPDLIRGTIFEVAPDSLVDVFNFTDWKIAEKKALKEFEDMQTIQASGYNAIGGMLMMGIFDPVNLLPVGFGAFPRTINLMRSGWSVAGRRIGKGAAAGVIGNTYAEGVLYAQQDFRTLQQSGINITAGMILGGMVGTFTALPQTLRHISMREFHKRYNLPMIIETRPPKSTVHPVNDPDATIHVNHINEGLHGQEIDPSRPFMALDEDFPVGTREQLLEKRQAAHRQNAAREPDPDAPDVGTLTNWEWLPRSVYNDLFDDLGPPKTPAERAARKRRQAQPHTTTIIRFSELRRLLGKIPSVPAVFRDGFKLPRPRIYVTMHNLAQGGSPHAAKELEIVGIEGLSELAHLQSISRMVDPDVPLEIVVVAPTRNQIKFLAGSRSGASNIDAGKLHRQKFPENKVPDTVSLAWLRSMDSALEPSAIRLRRSITCNSPCTIVTHEGLYRKGEVVPGGLHEDGTIGVSGKALEHDTTGAYNPDTNVTASEIASALGLEYIIGKWFPGVRLPMNPLLGIRQVTQKLFDTHLRYQNHALGIPGSRSAESGIRRWYHLLGETLQQVDEVYLKYRVAAGAKRFTEKRSLVGAEIFRLDVRDRFRGVEEGVYNKFQFYEEMGKAMRNQLEGAPGHPDPFVAEAAKLTREAHTAIFDAAVRVGIMDDFTRLGPDGKPTTVVLVGDRATAASHFRRVYNRILLAKPEERELFIKTVAEDWISYYRIGEHLQGEGGVEAYLKHIGIKNPAKLLKLARAAQKFEKSPTEKIRDPDTGVEMTAIELRREMFLSRDEAEFYRRRGYTPEQIEILTARDRQYFSEFKDVDGVVDPGEVFGIIRDFSQRQGIEGSMESMKRRMQQKAYDAAERAYDNIMGTPAGRTPTAEIPGIEQFFPEAGLTQNRFPGSTRPRTLDTPDSVLSRWLEDDARLVTRYLFRTMVPDIEIARNFGRYVIDHATGERRWVGDPNMKEAIARLQKEVVRSVAARRARGDTEESIEDFKREAAKGIKDLANVRDLLRGQYAVPANPEHMAYHTLQSMRAINYLTMGGGFALSSIPDISRLVTVNGLNQVIGTAMGILRLPRGTRMAAIKELGSEARLAGVAWETVLNQRAQNVFDLSDDYSRGSRVALGFRAAADRFSMITLLSPWNDMMKRWSAIFTGSPKRSSPKWLARSGQPGRTGSFGSSPPLTGRAAQPEMLSSWHWAGKWTGRSSPLAREMSRSPSTRRLGVPSSSSSASRWLQRRTSCSPTSSIGICRASTGC